MKLNDILPQEGDFLTTSLLEVETFVDDALHGTAAFATTGVRHDAVMAEIVAPTGDADKTGDFRAAEAFGHHVAVGFGERKVDVDGFLSGFGLRNEVGEGKVGIGACHEVGGVLVEEVFFHALGHAAQHP